MSAAAAVKRSRSRSPKKESVEAEPDSKTDRKRDPSPTAIGRVIVNAGKDDEYETQDYDAYMAANARCDDEYDQYLESGTIEAIMTPDVKKAVVVVKEPSYMGIDPDMLLNLASASMQKIYPGVKRMRHPRLDYGVVSVVTNSWRFSPGGELAWLRMVTMDFQSACMGGTVPNDRQADVSDDEYTGDRLWSTESELPLLITSTKHKGEVMLYRLLSSSE